MIYPKFVNDKVAFSSMPYPEDIPKITEAFAAGIILTYDNAM